jgi:subtilisin family serine protease
MPVDVVRIPPGAKRADLINAYKKRPDVAYAEPNYRIRIASIPNDTWFDELWALRNTGQSGGTVGADIAVTDVWSSTTGSAAVVVAVIDSGIDYNHPDLKLNIWSNTSPTFGDVHGARWTNGNGTPTSGDPMDGFWHGTHVAGTIGGVGNNGVGVAGVNWRVKLMALKFLDDAGDGWAADAVAAIEYAVSKGVRISNNSWGGGDYSQALRDAIATAGAAGHIFVAAAGNAGTDNDQTPFYPASYDCDTIVAVASSDRNDARSSFSCYGVTRVDLAAPGQDILSTYPNNGYAWANGTSMAAPHVSGTAALLLASHPGAPWVELKAWLLEGARPRVAWSGYTVTGGRLHVGEAYRLSNLPSGIAPVENFSATAGGDPSQVILSWSNPAMPGFQQVVIRRSSSDYPTRWDNGDAVYAGTAQSFTNGNVPVSGSVYYSVWANYSNGVYSAARYSSVSLVGYFTPRIQVSPAAIMVNASLGQRTERVLQVSNEFGANTNLTISLSVSETSRAIAPAAVQETPAHDFTQLAKDAEYRSGELLVRFDATVSTGAQRSQALAACGGGTVKRDFKLVPGLTVVTLPKDMGMQTALTRLNQTPGIRYAQPNYRQKLLRAPDDPLYSSLWGLHNTGQTGGTPNVDIDGPEAWDASVGGDAVIVAVIDTGIDYAHADLAANMWRNPGEIAGNENDDDGNGYVDDVYGYDFFNGDPDPKDDHDHGTHVAGTIGAVGNNGVGVAGVCWNVNVMALKFLSAAGEGYTDDAITCIQYAVANGARVLNASWGGGPYEQPLKDAIDAAGSNGVLFVAAAGNDYSNNNDEEPVYPASYASDTLLSVMSVTRTGEMSVFSNFGQQSVDVAAPGSGILSCKRGGGYISMNGTSMATPHVSGACALLWSINSGYSAQQIKQALISSADASLPGLCVAGGLMRLGAAVAEAPGWLRVDPVAVSDIAPGASTDITVTLDAGTLPAGTYQGVIRVASNDHFMPVTNVPVTLVILQDALTIQTGDGLVSSGYTGGPFTPSNTVYELTNGGSSKLSWSATHAQSWITVSPAGGSLAPGQRVSVTMDLNLQAGQLASGVFNDCVSFSNLTSMAVQRRDVALTVQERVLDHLEWDAIAPTQYVGTAFGVTVTARDATGNTLDDFTGPVPLRAFASNPSSRDVVTGASEWDFPLASWYHDARTQVIYLKSEVGGAALLTGLSLRVTQIPGQALNAWTIRLKHTPQSAYTGSVWEGDSWVVALQTNITISATGWVNFAFTTPFYYNGTDNLMVDFSFNNSSYTVDGLCWSTTVGSHRCLFFETDSQYGDPLNWAGVWPSGSVTNRVPTIRLDRRSPVAIAPTNAVGFVNGVWHGDITVPKSATGLFLFADAGLGRAGNSGVFDVVQAVALQEALDHVALAWTTGGSADWMGQTNVTHDGEDAARSGSISHRETTWMQTQVTGPGEISFWWRVSSEANWDWLEFYVNGVLADRISGETGWLKSSVYLTNGTHTLIWCYMKDGLDSGSVGKDCGWVDQVTGPLVSALPLAWLDTFGLARNGSVDFVDSDGDGFTNWQEWFADTVPTNARSLLRLEGITPEPDVGGFRVRWQSVTGKRYWVESCTNLIGSSPFIPFVSNIWGEVGGVTEIHDPRPLEGPARFYRVGVQPE